MYNLLGSEPTKFGENATRKLFDNFRYPQDEDTSSGQPW